MTAPSAIGVDPVFPATTAGYEARLGIFGPAVVGEEVGTFAPIFGSDIFGSIVGDYPIGYQVNSGGEILAVGVFVPVEPGSTQFSTPAQLISIVVTNAAQGDDIDRALAVFQRETLPSLGALTETVNEHDGGAPYYKLFSAIGATGVLFIAQPAGPTPAGSAVSLFDFSQKLSSLAS